jgi:hypothetical protein
MPINPNIPVAGTAMAAQPIQANFQAALTDIQTLNTTKAPLASPAFTGTPTINGTAIGGGGVPSVNGITSAVTLAAGSNVTITPNTPSAGSIQISASVSGGGGGITNEIIASAPITVSGGTTASATIGLGTVGIANGGTGATTAAAARTAILPTGGTSSNFLRGDMTWAAAGGGGGGTITDPITQHTATAPSNIIIAATNALPTLGMTIGNIFWRGGTTLANNSGAGISAMATQAWSSTSHPTDLRFAVTAVDSTSALTRMHIGANGAVAIGNLNPPTTGPNGGRGAFACERLFIGNADVTDLILGLL